jgi:imidazolonepropionase-like amidohydrolase
MQLRSYAALAILSLALGACATSKHAATAKTARADLSPLAEGESGYALRCGKILTVDDADNVFAPGLILVRGGKLAYVGAPRDVPAGYTVIDAPDQTATPGMVELHSHIHSGGFGDVNDMVMPVNPEFRASTALRPGNPLILRACAGGVTTLYGIPGSGTSLSGFGLVYKTKTKAGFDECVVRSPGGMKIAQSYNPERQAGDLGATRAGLAYALEDINDKAIAANRQGRKDKALENLQAVHARELPVLIHCAGSDGFTSAARMWKEKYDTRCVLSHGCFDAFTTADYIVKTGAPINAGPRVMDFAASRTGALVGTAERYLAAGSQDFSLCTDSPVMPQEELFLQGSMSARLGADSYQMLRAVTIHPAKVFGLAERVGSLEVGKDADVVLRNGEPLDPRSRVELVLIDGVVQYERSSDGQWF